MSDVGADQARSIRATRFVRYAQLIGGLWVSLGTIFVCMGASLLFLTLTEQRADRADTALILAFVLAYGLSLVGSGVRAWQGSRWGLWSGMVLSMAPFAYGYVSLPLTLIVLAHRTIRLSRPFHAEFGAVGSVLGRLAVAVLGVYGGAMIGLVIGACFGVLLGGLAAWTRLLVIHDSLGMIALATLAGVAGATGGGLAGMVAGLAAGRQSPRLVASTHLGGLVLGIAAVFGWISQLTEITSGSIEASRAEVVFATLMVMLTAALSTILVSGPAGEAVRWLDAQPAANRRLQA